MITFTGAVGTTAGLTRDEDGRGWRDDTPENAA
jgi:hypothetical protein